jgi:hypothetical protein
MAPAYGFSDRTVVFPGKQLPGCLAGREIDRFRCPSALPANAVDIFQHFRGKS